MKCKSVLNKKLGGQRSLLYGSWGKILILCIAIFMMFSMVCFANDSVIRDPNPELPSNGGENAKTFAENLIGAMMWIGYAIAVGMIVFIGIKYVIASADERASMKGMLVKVFIGSFIIVFAVTITNFLINTLSVGGSSSNDPDSVDKKGRVISEY